MDVKEAMKQWKSGQFSPVYVIYGKDRYRMGQFIGALTELLLPRDERELGIVKFDTSETSIEEAVAEAD
ncbi:DNA polymerase III subunit delta, partial [Paenibacillus sepulcri]|nr:DNA polymerase III subunit delta [Paenibacillus sepulcri]